MGPCVVRGKARQGGVGIFCRTFCVGREGFPQCMNVWCEGCFGDSPTDLFPRQQGVDTEDKIEVLTDNRDRDRYRRGRKGDHSMGVPFECDLCHFRSTNRRDPGWRSAKNMDTIETIRRVLLDVFWPREEGTVSANLSRTRRDYLDVQTRYSIGD